MHKNWRFTGNVYLILSVFALGIAGCFPGGITEWGPLRFDVTLGEGTLPHGLVDSKLGLTVTHDEPLCTLPSEEELAEHYVLAGSIDLSRFVRLSRLELEGIRFTATHGDFSFLSELSLYYFPAPEDGSNPDPIWLGTASNPNGFGATIDISPPEPIDFLELIRRHDQNSSGECPHLRIEAELRGIPTSEVSYRVSGSFAAYAWVGLL